MLPGAAAAAALAIFALAAQFSPQRAAAQSTPCTAIADDAERLACYDRALRSAAPEPPAPRTPAPAAPPPQTPSAPAAEPPAPNAAQAPAARQSPQPQDQDADKQTVPLVIVGVRTLPGRETLFTAQDGTVWVQTDSQRIVGLPATPFDAELKPGAMSSQFLVPKNGARAIRVRPVER
ncbi:MAG TPA: hypothetical protein VFL84_14355 [Gammaproteobacteria bacterium]|nr:hypothetical protein [Gammaproteobacteria bacterium]